MVSIKRRQFLQFSASTLASIGLSQVDFLSQAQRADRAMAQGTGRKLALLVGINNYPEGVNSLGGCLTDVEMQYELLVHRYGFNPKDILVLADTKLPFLGSTPKNGTRANILEAFQQHLIAQAGPEDTVVFHYSGHGSRVTDQTPLAGYDKLNGTLVPADVTVQGDQTNQIMGKTLFLLSSLLKTDNLTMVLDSCHSGAGTRGNSLVRAVKLKPRNGGEFCRPNAEELKLHETLIGQLKELPDSVQKRRALGIARGVALGSAQKTQEAIDAEYDGFKAGSFTYLLTRYLWQLPKDEPLTTTFGSLDLATKEASESKQAPIYDVQPQKNFETKPIYFMTPSRLQFADAVVRQIEGDKVQFWLGGVNSQSLKAFTKDAVFDVIDEKGVSIATVTQQGRDGLDARGKVDAGGRALKPGMFMRERLRSIPTDLKLKVGIDPNFVKDVEAAKAALAGISRVEPVVLGRGAPTEVHCILSRLTSESQAVAKRGNIQVDNPVNSWGLFNDKGVPIPNTFKNGDLAVDFVVKSLRSKLKLLLANQILSSTVNGDSSSLKVKTVIQPQAGGAGPVLTRMTAGLGGKPGTQESGLKGGYPFSTEKTPSIVNVLVSNQEEQRNLHIAAFSVGDGGEITLLHPASWDSPESASLVASQSTAKPIEMQIEGPAGFFEVVVVASTSPLREMLRGMQSIARGRGLKSGEPIEFDNVSARGAGESDDTIGDLMTNLVGDMSRGPGGKPPARGRALTDSRSVAVLSTLVPVGDVVR